MLLVPRQLRRAGITGDVPYYGGRFTPAQAYAASHPRPPAAAPRATTPGATTPGATTLHQRGPRPGPTPPPRWRTSSTPA